MAGGKVQKDPKITKFVSDVMSLRSSVEWHLGNNPLSGRPDKSANYEDLDRPEEAAPGDFRQVSTASGNITPAALVEIFQIYAHNLTRYRPVRMYVRASNGKTITDFGTKPTALKTKHKLGTGDFNAALPGSLFDPFQPGQKADGAAVDNLIAALRNLVLKNMNQGTYMTITACHNSCHSNCHGSRSRR